MITSVEEFVLSYSTNDEPKIAFAWNGKHAEAFVDKNIDFRREVCAYFVKNKSETPLALIASLYKAETQLAKEAWGVNRVALARVVGALSVTCRSWPCRIQASK